MCAGSSFVACKPVLSGFSHAAGEKPVDLHKNQHSARVVATSPEYPSGEAETGWLVNPGSSLPTSTLPAFHRSSASTLIAALQEVNYPAESAKHGL